MDEGECPRLNHRNSNTPKTGKSPANSVAANLPDFTVITASASGQRASSIPDLNNDFFSSHLTKGLDEEVLQNYNYRKDSRALSVQGPVFCDENEPKGAVTVGRQCKLYLIRRRLL